VNSSSVQPVQQLRLCNCTWQTHVTCNCSHSSCLCGSKI